jgi:diguanylate cyclase (GGDEF)-like protein/PAS domain S-box-containing protein
VIAALMLALVVAVGAAVVVVVRLAASLARLTRASTAAGAARERRYNLLEAIPDGIYIIDEAIRVTHINEEAERLLAAGDGPFVGRDLASILSPLASDLVPEIRRARREGAAISRLAHFAAAGWWIEIRILPAATESVVYLRDVTMAKRAQTQMAESESRLRLLMEQVPAVLWRLDRTGRFLSASGAGLAALDIDESALIGRDCASFLGSSGASTVGELLTDGIAVQFETPARGRWLRHHVEPLCATTGDVIGAVGVSLDISEIKTTRENLESAARLDALTHLPNRLALEEVLTDALSGTPDRAACAVLFVDLDRFKTINDTLGHRVGDEVLRVVAERLRSSVDEADVVARPGGDEFIIVLRSISSLENVGAVATRLLTRFDEPIVTAGRTLFVRGSVGAALAPQHGSTAEELIKNADAAMYRAKDRGRGTFAIYDVDMAADNLERLLLENDLRHAVVEREFVLQYQPIVDLENGRIVGGEALLRWRHPIRGTLEPKTFIRVAEDVSMMGEITRWVLAEACRFAAAVRLRQPDFRVTVNVSASDLRDGELVAVVRDQLARAALEPAGLEIEVTESALLDDTAIVTLGALRAFGVSIAVDDFGTAYNSLLYLKRLPITTLKIDRLFLDGVTLDGFDRSIVKAIVTLGTSLGLRVIAEGIESEEQWRFINSLACTEAQGFWFSSAVDRPAFEAMLVAAPDFGTRGDS